MSSFFIKSSSRRQAAPSSTPIHTSAQRVRRSAGQDLHHQGPPASNKGLQWPHRGVPSLSPPLSLLSPTIIVNTHTCAGDRPRAQPQFCSMGATAVGDTGTGQTSPSPCPLPTTHCLLTLTCWHCPTATSRCRSCSSRPGCPAPCSNTAGQTAVPPLLDTGVPVPLLPGHRGPFLFTLLVKLARGVQAPLSMAHSEAFPPRSSSRRSSGRPCSAPGNVPEGWVDGEGRPRTGPPSAAPTGCHYPPTPAVLTVTQALGQPDLPTAPHLPREWINSAWG